MPASVTAVDNLHADLAALLVFLDDASEVSLRNVADDNLRKALLLAAASYFEHRMTQDVIGFVEEGCIEGARRQVARQEESGGAAVVRH